MLLVIQAVVFAAQILVDAGKFGCQRCAADASLVRIFQHRLCNHFFQFVRDIVAVRVDGWRRRVHDLVQQFGQAVGTKRSKTCQVFIQDRTKRV